MSRRPKLRSLTAAAFLRRQAQRLEEALAGAEPATATGLLDKLTKLSALLAEAEARETAEPSPEELAAQRRAFDAEVERLIALRAEERALVMMKPDAAELERRARDLALTHGGAWRNYLERVREEQREWMYGLEDEWSNSRKTRVKSKNPKYLT